MPDINAMRTDPRAWTAAWRELRVGGSCEARLLPIHPWGKKELVLLTPLALKHGPQRLEVIDLTSFDNTTLPAIRAARFASCCPEPHWASIPPDPAGDAARLAPIRRHVIYVEPDEGHACLLDNSGRLRWVDSWCVGLVAHVVPGTKEEHVRLRADLGEELAENLDAGGRLNF